jgi:hypothetical protein
MLCQSHSPCCHYPNDTDMDLDCQSFSLFCILFLYSYDASELGYCPASLGLQFSTSWTIAMLLYPVTRHAKYVFFPYGQKSKFIFIYNNKVRVCVYAQSLITITIFSSYIHIRTAGHRSLTQIIFREIQLCVYHYLYFTPHVLSWACHFVGLKAWVIRVFA